MVDYSKYQHIKVEKRDKVAVFTLNRPESLNAINHRLHDEIILIFHEVSHDPEVNAVVLTGAGRAFSSGGDIKAMAGGWTTSGEPPEHLGEAWELVLSISECEQPVIAAVNGDAIGLGAQVALFCDIIIAAENARFSDPHVRVGLTAGDGGAVIWPLLIGPAKAKEYLLTGDFCGAREAERIGLINRVVPAEQLMPTAMELAQRLAKGATRAIRYTKMSVNKKIKEDVNSIMPVSVLLEHLTMATKDHPEALSAFLQKREPVFTGK